MRFDEFMADDLATVERIYDLADQPFDDAARAAIATYLADHQRNRHGSLIYDLADFDLDAATIRAGLSDYIDRFQIPLEPLDTTRSTRHCRIPASTAPRCGHRSRLGARPNRIRRRRARHRVIGSAIQAIRPPKRWSSSPRRSRQDILQSEPARPRGQKR